MGLKSKDLLGAFNVEKGSMIIPNLMIILGTGTLVNLFSSTDKVPFLSWAIAVVLIGLPILVYMVLKFKELQFSKVEATQKSILIMVYPSNLALLRKLMNIKSNQALEKNKFGIDKIYFITTKNMPVTEENRKAMEVFLKGYSVKYQYCKVDALENPKKLQYEVESILNTIPNKNNCAINIQTGTKASSVILYEIAMKNRVEVHYLSSLYDKNNDPIDNSETLYTLRSEYINKS